MRKTKYEVLGVQVVAAALLVAYLQVPHGWFGYGGYLSVPTLAGLGVQFVAGLVFGRCMLATDSRVTLKSEGLGCAALGSAFLLAPLWASHANLPEAWLAMAPFAALVAGTGMVGVADVIASVRAPRLSGMMLAALRA